MRWGEGSSFLSDERNQEDVSLQHLAFPVVKLVDVDTVILFSTNAKGKCFDR